MRILLQLCAILAIADVSLASIVPYKAFKTKDGRILLGGGNDRLFGIICDQAGHPEWKQDPRFTSNALRVQNRAVLDDLIDEAYSKKTTQEWVDQLKHSGLPYGPINDVKTTLENEHVLARNMVQEIDHPTCGPMKLVNTPLKFSHSEPGVRTPPPTLGQHTDEILEEVVGFSKERIATLKSDGVVS